MLKIKLKIRHKLFFAILVANAILVSAILVFGSWIFDTSFRDYLDQTEATRLAPLADDLANEYSNQGDWRWVENRRHPTWRRLVSPYMNQGPGKRRSALGNNGDRPPPPDERRPPDRRPGPNHHPLLLLDQNQQLIIGRPREIDQVYWIPIKLKSTVVGQLGFVRRTNITSGLDALFIERIKSNFSWMILGILLISAIISIPLSRIMVRPIEKLKRAMHSLTSGNFKASLTHQGNDELAELVEDFNTLSQTLDKNLTLRQQWIADVSHELRTPVAVLQGELEAIQDDIRKFDKAAVDSLHQEILRLSRLVNDLHELSLSDLGALSYEKTSVNMLELIQAVIDQHGDSLKAQSIDVTLQFPTTGNKTNYYPEQPSDFFIHGDVRRLGQLFTNLANNTQHYTQAPGKLLVSIRRQSSQIEIIWSDSTPGVSNTDITRLFDRLFRVEASRNRNTGGSGLGLAICQNIVTAHQGCIGAKHSEFGGVSIVMTFPQLSD